MNNSQKIVVWGTFAVVIAVTSYVLFASHKKRRKKKEDAEQKELRLIRSFTLHSCLSLVSEKTHVVETEEDWERVHPKILNDLMEIKVLGFDCEWVTGLTKSETSKRRAGPVALLQLATSSDLCVLVRLCKLPLVPSTLRSLLENRSILKVGVACVDDANKLLRDHGLVVKGCVDLRNLATRARLNTQFRGLGLGDLASSLLGIHLDKSPRVRNSNWEADILTPKQVEYAAQDAAVATHIFRFLVQQKLSRLSQRQGSQGEELWRCVTSMCQGLVDVNYSGKTKNTHRAAKVPETGCSKPGITEKPIGRAYSIRRKPLYHNCQLRAPDGQLLCTCDVKKAQWYVEKGLARVVKEEPFTVQLNFEPSGRPMDDRNYYLQDKHNMCVVCGKEESYTRKSVVPHEYRKYFPPMMKEHRSHDVVLLCTACHQQSGCMDAQLRMQLAIQCHAPMGTENGVRFKHEPQMLKVRSAAKALLLNSAQLPEARRNELEQLVESYFGVESLTEEILKAGMDLDTRIVNDGYVPHGEKVVRHMMAEGGLVAFERMWRQNFLDSMQPKFLPALWSVDHSHMELEAMDSGMKEALSNCSTKLPARVMDALSDS